MKVGVYSYFLLERRGTMGCDGTDVRRTDPLGAVMRDGAMGSGICSVPAQDRGAGKKFHGRSWTKVDIQPSCPAIVDDPDS